MFSIPKTREAALEVLGFNPKDKPGEGEIRKAYYKLARKWHTDKNESSKAKEKIQAINVAYGLLTGEIDEQFIKEQTNDDWTNRFGEEYFRNFCKRMYGDHLSDEEGYLFGALVSKDLEQVKALIGQLQTLNIEHRIQYDAIKAPNSKKEYVIFGRPLHYIVRNACQNPDQGWEELLREVSPKVDINALISVDGTALCVASRLGHLGVVKTLLEHGADPNLKGLQSPLEHAAKGNHSSIVETLFTHGAKIDHISLFLIITKCNETTAGIFLSNTSLEERNRLLKMFFCNEESCKEAHEDKNLPVIKLLLEKYGADPNYTGSSNISSLEMARDHSNKDLVKLLEQYVKEKQVSNSDNNLNSNTQNGTTKPIIPQSSTFNSNQNNGQGSSGSPKETVTKPMPGPTIIPGSTFNGNQNNGQGSSGSPKETVTSKPTPGPTIIPESTLNSNQNGTSKTSIITQSSSSDNSQSNNNTRSLLIGLAIVAGAVIGAVALYFFAPLIFGTSIGIGAQLGLGIAGAAIGGGIGYLTNVAISQCCSSKAHAA